MQDLLSLNDLFKQYSRGDLKKKSFEELIFKSVLGDYQRYHLFDGNREECIDYLCWLYPRISRSIDNYRDTGSSFDAYIGALIRYSVKEYRSREADRRAAEYSAWTIRTSEFPSWNRADNVLAAEAEPEYGRQRQPALVSNPRQILILLLKSYYFVSDDFAARAAPILGMEKETVKELLDRLRKKRIKRDEAIRHFQERIHCQFYRCITYESRLCAIPADLVCHAKMKIRLERARRRLAAMKKRLAGIRMEATNRQISEILGVSKGAVDASLHALRLRWKRHLTDRKNPKGDITLS
jgi:DNA-directed RNA polymerase specialized sigma24 family protein